MLTLVRHGQASFGSEDYDRLSDLGQRQCLRLGEYFRHKERRFDTLMRGALRRHEQSLQALLDGLQQPDAAVEVLPGLDEYDGDALIRALGAQAPQALDTAEGYRGHFRLLRQALAAWMEGRIEPEGMPRYADFAAGIAQVLERVRGLQGEVLVVSSGGPIATAIGQVLAMPVQGTIELNMRIRNSALTEFAFNPRRHALHSFNRLPHLEGDEYAGWITYA